MTAKRASTAFSTIRVLLIHENELARRAWEKVLGKSGQITVLDSIETINSYHLHEDTRPPEIIIASMATLKSGVLRIEHLKEILGVSSKLIILAESKEDVRMAFKEGANWAAAEPIEPQELITQVRALSGEAELLCSEYHDEIRKIREGISQNRRFCNLVNNSFQLLFQPDLVNPEFIDMPRGSSPAGRLVFRNQAKDHEFWIEARQTYQSKYVTVDIYNRRPTPKDVRFLGKYLSEVHGLLGLIVGRKPHSNGIHRIATSLVENERKAILVLDISLLCEMLEYKAGGINPVCLLQDRYQELIASSR